MSSPFRGSEAVRDGHLSKDQLRTPARRLRLFRDVYVAGDVEVTHALRCRAAALILPAGAVFSGRSAACLHGAGLVEADAPVEVTTDRKIRPRPGMVDSLLALGRLSIDAVAAYAGRRSWRGVNRMPDVLELAIPGAESPMETRLRLVLVRAGLLDRPGRTAAQVRAALKDRNVRGVFPAG